MTTISRRTFIKAGTATGAMAGMGTLPVFADQQGKATDWVKLGKSNVKVTRLAFGTGTFNGRVQQQLGQEAFTSLVRHAYDRGIRFFETSESYVTSAGDSPKMLSIALKGLPRESYQIMTKVTTGDGIDPVKKLDMMRQHANTDYFDIMLLHWQHNGSWPADSRPWQDAISEAQQKKAILARGASVHGLPALRQVTGMNWLEVAMIRMNHKGTRMDSESGDSSWFQNGNVNEVVDHVHGARAAGLGVISMKLVGEGTFNNRADRQAAMRFAFRNAGVNCVTVGYKNAAEVDEAIENVNLALA